MVVLASRGMLYYNMSSSVMMEVLFSMEYRNFFDKIASVRGEIGLIEGEPMKNHTTCQIGGPADVFVQPRSLAAFIHICSMSCLPEAFHGPYPGTFHVTECGSRSTSRLYTARTRSSSSQASRLRPEPHAANDLRRCRIRRFPG